MTEVGSAADALATLGTGTFDVLVCDLELPVTNGHTLLRTVRAGGRANANIRAIAITAHADDESRAAALASGFDDFLPKLVSALLVPTVARLRQPQ